MSDAVHAPAPQTQVRFSIFWVLVLVPGSLIALLLVLAGAAWNSGLRSFTNVSSSMEPAILQGDVILANMTYYLPRKPKDRDIVLFQRGKIIFIKRVIASGGETIQGSEGKVYVNGQLQSEPYVQHTGKLSMKDFGPLTVPTGQFFVMGDNRDFSNDSRSTKFGFVTEKSVFGRPLRVLFNPRTKRTGKVIQ